MKKTCLSLLLVLSLLCGCLTGICLESKNASASIYFSGEYSMKTPQRISMLTMSEYSSPEGKVKGSFRLSRASSNFDKIICDIYDEELTKCGKNKYYYKDTDYNGKVVKIIFKVYKKKVKIKQKKTNHNIPIYFTGTYKKDKAYPRP